MHRRQTVRPHIWIFCPPRHPSFFEAILPLSSETSVSLVKQAPSTVTQRDAVMFIMTYRPEAKQWTMAPKPRVLSPTHKQATCSSLSN
ncbi:hypothetical protein TNCV_1584071 [Trichonephila clavipes]|nr:hypothetical protein TNCV_1584071 [Trichonephila clavipes]